MFKILVINPGSTSTKIACYKNSSQFYFENLHHDSGFLSSFSSISSQQPFRLKAIQRTLSHANIDLAQFDAFVGRGGLLCPISSGTYIVDDEMLQDLVSSTFGEHASNLGGVLAHFFGKKFSKPAYIVDPVVVDELEPVARLSGHPQFPRKSIFHALNHKAVGRKLATKLKKEYSLCRFIIGHLGGGVSIAAHLKGRVVDVNNALDGEGAFSPERSGTLPVGDLVRFCFRDNVSQDTVISMIKSKGGLVAYSNTNSFKTLSEAVTDGDNSATLVYNAMAYQISKEIGAYATVLHGNVDAIGLSGGIVFDKRFVHLVEQRVKFIAPVFSFPGEFEMQALAEGAFRVLAKQEKPYCYATRVKAYD